MTNSIAELENTQCIFIIGSNTMESQPIIASRILKAKEKGARLIVADPRRIHIASYADIHVQHRLGSDVALINSMMHVILKEGWEDKKFIAERTEGFDALKEKVREFSPEKVEEITGVKGEDVRKMAELYANSEVASIVYAMGITQHSTGTDNVKSLCNLAMLCGNVGKEGGGVNPLRGQNNVQGACDMGALPNLYPGYQRVDNEDVAKKFEEAWKVKLSRKPGLTIPDMFHAIEEGKLKALFILGENPMLSDPDIHHVEEALKSLDLLVVQDIFLTETSKFADVILPGSSFAEKDGTFTNTERRVQRVRKAIEPMGECRPDWKIIGDLASKMGYPIRYEHPSQIQEEISLLTPSYGGITYDRLDGEGLRWPCPDKDHPGTVYLHKDKFTRGLGLFHAIDYIPPAELPDEEYPLMLTTGRVFFYFNNTTMTRKSPLLNKEVEKGYLEINPDDAQRLGIKDGKKVKVISRRGEIEIDAHITNRVDVGVVFLPFHFVESAANILTNPAFDPIAKIPEFKVCAVAVRSL
jgi:formate dehydrogenase alpha subunit